MGSKPVEADRAVPTEDQGLWESGPLGAVSGSRDLLWVC